MCLGAFFPIPSQNCGLVIKLFRQGNIVSVKNSGNPGMRRSNMRMSVKENEGYRVYFRIVCTLARRALRWRLKCASARRGGILEQTSTYGSQAVNLLSVFVLLEPVDCLCESKSGSFVGRNLFVIHYSARHNSSAEEMSLAHPILLPFLAGDFLSLCLRRGIRGCPSTYLDSISALLVDVID